MTRTKQSWTARVLVLWMLGAVAISGLLSPAQAAPARIKSAVMSKKYVNGKAVGVTTTFKPSERAFHCVVVLDRVTTTSAKAVWTAVAVAGAPKNTKIREDKVGPQRMDNLHFTISLNQNWPKGKYKVAVFLNNKLAKTLNFSVK